MSDDSNEAELIELSHSPSLSNYIREIWIRREFAVVVPINDMRAQNMDTALGQLWHLINPMMLISVFYLVFGIMLDTDRGVDNFLGFLVIGVLLFQLSQRTIQESAASIRRNEFLIRSIQFPRALLPVSAVVGQTVAFLPSLLVLVALVLITGEVPTSRWLLLPVILICQAVFGLGASLIVARIGFVMNDVQQILPHLFRLLFYISGVLFSVETFITNLTIKKLFAINPFYDIITIARWSLMDLSAPLECIIGLTVWTITLPIIGIFYFRSNEHRYGA